MRYGRLAILQVVVAVLQLRLSASTLNSRIHHTKQLSVRKHGYGVALYPPPEVGGFTATNDKQIKKSLKALDG